MLIILKCEFYNWVIFRNYRPTFEFYQQTFTFYRPTFEFYRQTFTFYHLTFNFYQHLPLWDGTEYLYAHSTALELTKYTRNHTAFLLVLNVFNALDAMKIFDWLLDEAKRLSSHPLIRKLEEELFKRGYKVIKDCRLFCSRCNGETMILTRQRLHIDLHYLSFAQRGQSVCCI